MDSSAGFSFVRFKLLEKKRGWRSGVGHFYHWTIMRDFFRADPIWRPHEKKKEKFFFLGITFTPQTRYLICQIQYALSYHIIPKPPTNTLQSGNQGLLVLQTLLLYELRLEPRLTSHELKVCEHPRRIIGCSSSIFSTLHFNRFQQPPQTFSEP